LLTIGCDFEKSGKFHGFFLEKIKALQFEKLLIQSGLSKNLKSLAGFWLRRRQSARKFMIGCQTIHNAP
jgi:hypothetical protein